MKLEDATVLLVDDLLPLREVFSIWLSRSGCAVLTAPDGLEAIKLLTTQKVDAILSDIRMPVMDGMMLAQRLAGMQIRVPVLLLSGMEEMEMRRPLALGVRAILTKPVNRQELLGALENSLKTCEEMWHEPLPTRPEDTVTVDLETVRGPSKYAGETGFLLGSGGCAFVTPRPLHAGDVISLVVSFARERISLRGEVKVRWSDPQTGWAGVEFLYLAPASRDWVVSRLKTETPQSYIPSPTI